MRNRRLAIEYVATDNLKIWDRNPNVHPPESIEAIKKSIAAHGFRNPIIVRRDGMVVEAGHGRLLAAKELGIAKVPCIIFDDDEVEAMAYSIADNRSAEFSYLDTLVLKEVLLELDSVDKLGDSLYNPIDLKELLHSIDKVDVEEEVEKLRLEKGRKEKRSMPLDIIFCLGEFRASILASLMGLMIGTRSDVNRFFEKEKWQWAFKLDFVDNDYRNYNHQKHLDFVAAMCPKYATVRDIMLPSQCEELGIPYYDLDTILGWAEDLKRYAQHVILIPKYDCINDLPPDYTLGFSVPSSYGHTEISIEKFKGRRVHLLGGSWSLQLSYLSALGDCVASLDTNIAYKLARIGRFILPGRGEKECRSMFPFPIVKPLAICLALSFNNMIADVRELIGDIDQVEDEEQQIEEANEWR
jgi:ParB-like chromosome segregation protein Spo0J